MPFEIEFFYSPGACSLASHIALEEVAAPYTAIETSIAKGRNRSPEYLAINPNGTVPSLLLDGRLITENTAILCFLGQQYPSLELLPQTGIELAHAIARMAWFSNTPHIWRRAILRPGRFLSNEAHYDDLVAVAKINFWRALQDIDRLLDNDAWIMGERYSLVDPYALVFYNWGIVTDLPMRELRNYTRWKNKMLDRSAVRAVLEREGNERLLAPAH